MNFESSAFTSPSGVTISGLISQSIESAPTKAVVELPTMPRICFCSFGSSIPGAVDQAARLVGLEAFERIDVEARERLGPVGGDLLDVDPALLREHEERLLLAPVERDREVVLLGDLRGLLDPELADDVAVDVQAEDRLGVLSGLVGRVGELDPAGLPAAAGQHLGLDDDLAAELLGRRARLVRRRREPPLGDGDAEPLEELLALVLVEIHRAATLTEHRCQPGASSNRRSEWAKTRP